MNIIHFPLICSQESFNFRDSSTPYPILLDYAICIKRQVGFCGLTLNVATEGDGFGLNRNEIGLNTGLACHAFDFTQRVQDNSSDFLQLSGAFVTDGINRRPGTLGMLAIKERVVSSFEFLLTLKCTDSYFCGVYDTLIDPFPGISCECTEIRKNLAKKLTSLVGRLIFNFLRPLQPAFRDRWS